MMFRHEGRFGLFFLGQSLEDLLLLGLKVLLPELSCFLDLRPASRSLSARNVLQAFSALSLWLCSVRICLFSNTFDLQI